MQYLFAFVMALLCSLVFLALLVAFRKSEGLYVHSNMLLFLFLAVVCVVRPLVIWEPPFAIEIVSSVVYPALLDALSRPIVTVATVSVNLFSVLAMIWLCGSIVFAAWGITRHRKAMRCINRMPTVCDERVQNALHEIVQSTRPKAKYRLLVSPQVGSPAMLGVFNPIVVMPTIHFTDEELYVVLQHEWSHYIHRDNLVRSVIGVMSVIFWWFPLLHFLNKEAAEAQEYISDLRATKGMSELERSVYVALAIQITLKICGHIEQSTVSTRGLAGASHYVGDSSKRYVKRLSGLSRYDAKSGRVFKVFATFVIVLVLLASFVFIFQPYYEPPDDGSIGVNFESSYVVAMADGTYELYINGESVGQISAESIASEPFSSFAIIFND